MGALPLFPQGDPGRDRALGALLGAARGAREARRFMGGTAAADWPDAQAVMIHTAHALLETGTLAPADLLRRLLTDWAQGMGRPRLLRVTDPDGASANSRMGMRGLHTCSRRIRDLPIGSRRIRNPPLPASPDHGPRGSIIAHSMHRNARVIEQFQGDSQSTNKVIPLSY